MSHKAQMIKDYIERNEQEFQEANKVYLESVEKMRNIDLAHINKGDAEQIIKYYLYKWGKMQRALKLEKLPAILDRVQSKSNRETLNKFRKKKLSDTDIRQFKTDIEKCYDSFKSIIGKTAASKVLHLICPDFFAIWDTKIADAYRRERKNNKIEADSGADYYEFMQWAKDFMREHDDVLTERDGRTKVKVLDDFLWAVANRPLMIFK